jgi:pimeloyl-ACP methyl ester carboxylesterase/2-polyprenyl-6-methoxyphenol hydroxylase-like FAD-dependent oxidoreductase
VSGQHGVVIGAGMAGLMAAAALTDSCERVTVLDRDAEPEGFEARRGVPQGRHVHGLTIRGMEAIEELLPGIRDELIDDGAPTFSPNGDFRFEASGHRISSAMIGKASVLCTRPFLEAHLRRRVAALAGVELRHGCEVSGLIPDGNRRRVAGVILDLPKSGDADNTLLADLVVAATGRSARITAWLEELGYGRPPESKLSIDLGYATRRWRMAPDALRERGLIVGPRAGEPRGLAIFAVEDDSWLVTLAGFGAAKPQADEDDFAAFLAEVAPADVQSALAAGEPDGEIFHFGYPFQRRRRFERMRRFPDGLLPIGDAICSFDPIYGQGMTVAALEALALRALLRRGTDGLRRRYLRAASRIVGSAWNLATAADLAIPEIGGEPSLTVKVQNAYVERLQRAAVTDGEAAVTLIGIVSMTATSRSALRPRMAWRALRGARPTSPPWPPRTLQAPVRRRTLRVGGLATPLREAGPADGTEAVVFAHGVPGSGADFEPLLAATASRLRSVAWDAPGFGHADKPAGFDHSVEGHAAFFAAVLEELGIDRVHLVVHDFGAAWGLRFAADNPEQVAAVTLMNGGLTLDYRWHLTARVWRTPRLGELTMATQTRASFRAAMRPASPRRLPRPYVDRMFDDFDAATRAAILRLYRSVTDVRALAREVADALAPANHPALIIWGESDPYLGKTLAWRQREGFPDAAIHLLPGAGHWPFVDAPEECERLLTDFVSRVAPESTVVGL